jgi:hypothetical protein
MGRAYRLLASGVFEIQIKILLVALYALFSIAHKYFLKTKFMGLA